MSGKNPYGSHYEHRGYGEQRPGFMKFYNHSEQKEKFLTFANAQILQNEETKRVERMKAYGTAVKLAKARGEPPPSRTQSPPRKLVAPPPPAPPPARQLVAPPPPAPPPPAPAPAPHNLGFSRQLVAPGNNLRPAGANPRATYATEQEKANLRGILTQRIVGSYAVVTQGTMTNGDCLYSSIYRAAFEQGLNCVIESILGSYNGPMPGNIRAGVGGSISEEEMRFVQAARYLVSDEIRNDIEDFYDRIVIYFENDKPTYDAIVGPGSTLDGEIIVLIKRYIEGAPNHDMRIANKVSFIRDYKNNTINLVGGNIPSKRIYSGEFENNAIIRLIKMLCNINIISITSELRTREIQFQPDTIYIENQGGRHYEYFQIGEPLPDRDPTLDEVIARSKRYIPIEIINSILSEYRGNLNGIINKIIEVYGGIPRGLNRSVNTNYSNEYKRLRNARVHGGTRRRRKTKRRLH